MQIMMLIINHSYAGYLLTVNVNKFPSRFKGFVDFINISAVIYFIAMKK